jgi:hypothetical protein
MSLIPSAPLTLAAGIRSLLALHFYLARAFEDEIKFLRDLVIMPLCPASRGDARFRKALILDGRIRSVENGAFGKSDTEHGAIGTRAGRRQRS